MSDAPTYRRTGHCCRTCLGPVLQDNEGFLCAVCDASGAAPSAISGCGIRVAARGGRVLSFSCQPNPARGPASRPPPSSFRLPPRRPSTAARHRSSTDGPAWEHVPSRLLHRPRPSCPRHQQRPGAANCLEGIAAYVREAAGPPPDTAAWFACRFLEDLERDMQRDRNIAR